MNAFEKYNLEDCKKIEKMIKKSSHVFSWVRTSAEEGEYLEIKKGSLRNALVTRPSSFDSNQCELRPCYIGGVTSQALYID